MVKSFFEAHNSNQSVSNCFRFIDGVADAAAWNSIVSILMVIFPNKAAFIVASTETIFGVGMSIGKKLLEYLLFVLSKEEFKLPFVSRPCSGISTVQCWWVRFALLGGWWLWCHCSSLFILSHTKSERQKT